MEEIWKDIQGYEGIYQVSDLGRIRSLDRIMISKNKFGEYHRMHKGRIMNGCINKVGYISVNFIVPNRRTFTIHQLVAIAFLNHVPCGYKIVVDHIDHNPLNNRADNLQLITNRYNNSKDKKGGTSQYVGVCWHKKSKRWRSVIQINRKNIYLGSFINEIDAHLAYEKALNNNLKTI